MANLNTFSYEDAVDLINREYNMGMMNPLDNVMKKSGIVMVQTVPMGSGSTRRHKEMPVGDLYAADKAEGAQSTNTRVQQGYYKDTTSRTFSKKIDITLEMRTLNKTGEIYSAAKFIGGVCMRREDLNLSMFISFGTSTSYLNQDGRTVDISTGDGLAPFVAAHTLTGSTTTYRNRLANNPAFSETALELMEDLYVTNIFTNLGEQIGAKPDIIYSTDNPTLVNAIKRVIQSTAQISAPNEGVINVYEGKYKHMMLNKIDMNPNGVKDAAKRNYWGMCDTTMASFYHDIYHPATMVPPEFGDGKDINTLDWTWNSYDMHDSCIVAGRGLTLSTGDGVA